MLTAEFEENVRNALLHYGDSARLCTNPLLDRLSARHLPIEDRLGELRAALRQAINSLRPPDTVPYSHADWLPYRVLWGRCIQRRNPLQIGDELGLSRATFYRYQAQAIQVVCRVLWERIEASSSPPSLSGVPAVEPPTESPPRWGPPARERVDLQALVAGVQSDMQALLERQNVTLHVRLCENASVIYGDGATLRQIVLNALAAALRLSTGPTLRLEITATPQETRWEIQADAQGRAPVTAASDQHPELDLCAALLQPYGGQITWAESPTGFSLRFTLPTLRPPKVVVVDDDQDTLALYERYLRRAGLDLQIASDSARLWALLEEGYPDLIVLDVLMPHEDGWMVLQRLQTLPETAEIPVIVCSVLAQPSLALTLGARQVLLKPISESALLQAVMQVLGWADSEHAPPQ